VLADRTLPDGRHLVIGDRHGVHRLWLPDPDPLRPVAIVIAHGAGILHRAAAAYRLALRLGGRAAGPVPRGLVPTRLQRRRLGQLLRLLDASAARATRREMAAVLYPAIRAFSGREWAASTERRTTQRALDKARVLMAGGYRTLLAGA
jgi:hypothetical protein